MKKNIIISILLLILFFISSCSMCIEKGENDISENAIKEMQEDFDYSMPFDDMVSNSKSYHFNSFQDLHNSLAKNGSEEYRELHLDNENYGDVYKNTLDSFTNGEIDLYVPTINDNAISLRDEPGHYAITLMTNDLYSLPWIWYQCMVGEELVRVCIAYTQVLDGLSLSSNSSYLEIQTEIAPDAPSPSNCQIYENYKNIYEKTIVLNGEKSVKALVKECSDIDRMYVSFCFDGMLCNIFAREDMLTDEFFSKFGLQKYL